MYYAILLLGSITFLDICLSGDNAVVIAMTANRLQRRERDFAIFFGMALAIVLRVVLCLIAVRLLAFRIIALLGGVALLWVAYKLVKESIASKDEEAEAKTGRSLLSAIGLIVLADLSMSLDNVLAVASLARNHIVVMALGILASIGILAFASRWVADLMQRWKWLNLVGICLIVYVAIDLIAGNYEATLTWMRN